MGLGSTFLRVPWPSTAATIPAGFTRDTDYDAKFLQGDDNTFVGGANGGAAHTHVDSTNLGAGHNHVGFLHAHTVDLAHLVSFAVNIASPPLGANFASAAAHSHAQSNSGAAQTFYSVDTISVGFQNMEPPYLRVILLTPDDAQQEFPAGGLALGDSATPPDGFSVVGAAWDGLYLYGAAALGDGGGTGGSATHNHGGLTTAHNHTVANHTHPAAACGASSATLTCSIIAGTDSGLSEHHNVSLDDKALADVSNETMLIGDTSSEPRRIELLGLTADQDGTPDGIILPFVGPYTDLPSDGSWILCDGAGGTVDCTDRQVKITTDTANIGTAAGLNNHTHIVGANHVHTHGPHNHAATQTTLKTVVAVGANGAIKTRFAHNHGYTVGNSTPTMGVESHAVTIADADGRYNYRTCMWVKNVRGACTVNVRGAEICGAVLAGV